MAGPSLDSLPPELQLMVFGFAYSDCQINITEHQKCGTEEDTLTPTTASKLEQPLMSKATHAAAWQAYLTSATWCFASMAAAEEFLDPPSRSPVLRHIKHVRVDAKAVNPTRLVALFFQAGCTLRSVELVNCTAFDFGLPRPTSGVMSAMQRDETEVLQHLFSRSCRAVNATTLSKEVLDECFIVKALAGIPTLEHVAIRAECEVCAEYGLDCDWSLVARKAELCVLQAVAEGGRASRTRERSIARSEKGVKALEDATLARDRLECVDVYCGVDWEIELETGEELAVFVG